MTALHFLENFLTHGMKEMYPYMLKMLPDHELVPDTSGVTNISIKSAAN